jgi:hypothetical protein
MLVGRLSRKNSSLFRASRSFHGKNLCSNARREVFAKKFFALSPCGKLLRKKSSLFRSAGSFRQKNLCSFALLEAFAEKIFALSPRREAFTEKFFAHFFLPFGKSSTAFRPQAWLSLS